MSPQEELGHSWALRFSLSHYMEAAGFLGSVLSFPELRLQRWPQSLSVHPCSVTHGCKTSPSSLHPCCALVVTLMGSESPVTSHSTWGAAFTPITLITFLLFVIGARYWQLFYVYSKSAVKMCQRNRNFPTLQL